MKQEDRFEALAVAEAGALERIADEILAVGVRVSVTAGPESVSAPVRVGVPGAGNTSVVLGHVALTRCPVMVNGVRGDGFRVGHDLTGAVAAAICDAECERDGSNSPRVQDLCRAAQASEAHRHTERAGLVAKTTLDEP